MRVSVKVIGRNIDLVLDVEPTATVEEIRGFVATRTGSPADRIRLIFSGRVLEDKTRTLADEGILDGFTLHSVVRLPTPAAAPSAPRAGVGAGSGSGPGAAPGAGGVNPFAAMMGNMGAAPGAAGGANPFAAMMGSMGAAPGAGGANPFAAMMGNMGGGRPNFQEMQQQLMANPELMSSIMQSPMMQQMMGDENVMRDLMLNSPQMRELLEANPSLRHVLEDPATMRRAMSAMRNPGMMAEMTRQNDRAMANIESMPGGYNALRRNYEEVAEPMADASMAAARAAMERGGGGGATRGGGGAGASTAGGAMPNPWARRSPTAATPGAGAGGAGAGAGMGGGMAAMLQQMMGGGAPPGGGGGTGQAGAGMGGGMAAMLQQMMGGGGGTPGAGGSAGAGGGMPNMASLLSNPMMQQTMSTMMQNPEFMRQAMGQFGGGGGGGGGGAGANRGFGGLGGFGGGENPFGSFLGAPAAPAAPPAPRGRLTADAVANALRELATESVSSDAPATAPADEATSDGFDVSALAAALPPDAATAPAAPAEPYAAQLASLDEMGFTDRSAALRALTAANGDVDVAIERLLSGS